MELNNDNIEPKKRYEYTPCYCEGSIVLRSHIVGTNRLCLIYSYLIENIWKWLDTQLSENQDGLYYAVFISNPSANVFFWNHSGKEYVIWDYHVIGLFKRSKTDSMWKVMDFDGKSFMKPVTDDPCEGMVELNQYLSQCFTDIPREHFVPRFRVVSAKNYIKYFSSDRSHMVSSV